MKYDRLVRDVKRALPYAKDAHRMLIETYEYLETLPTKKARAEHMKRVEASIKAEYTPKMKQAHPPTGKTAHQTDTPRVQFLYLSGSSKHFSGRSRLVSTKRLPGCMAHR